MDSKSEQEAGAHELTDCLRRGQRSTLSDWTGKYNVSLTPHHHLPYLFANTPKCFQCNYLPPSHGIGRYLPSLPDVPRLAPTLRPSFATRLVDSGSMGSTAQHCWDCLWVVPAGFFGYAKHVPSDATEYELGSCHVWGSVLLVFSILRWVGEAYLQGTCGSCAEGLNEEMEADRL